VFFPQGCDSGDGSLYLIWASNGRIIFSRSDDRGLSWMTPERIDRGPTSVVPSASPHLACYGPDAFVVWKDSRDGDHHVYFTRSVDYGETWPAADKRLDTFVGAVDGYHNGPFLTADSYADVNVAWVKNGHLYFNFSWDAGDTWAPAEIQIDQLGILDPDSSRPSMAADGLGNIYVAWTSTNGQMYLSRSADWGQTWLPVEQRISDNYSVIAVAGTITADTSGHVYGAWYYQAQGSSIFDVRFNTSSDYGVTWQEKDTQLGTTGISVHPFTPTWASDNNGRVYAIWLRYITPGDRHIYGNASFDYGATWAGGEGGFQVDSATASMDINPHQPFAACDQAGTGAATWIDRRDSAQWHMQINTFNQSDR
jgi:hypothetical protein